MTIEDPVKKLSDAVSQNISNVLKDVRVKVEQMVADAIKAELASFDDAVVRALNDNFTKRLDTFNFPDESIPIKALRFDQAQTLSGDRVAGGIIRNFNSTGIQDSATDCRITILDESTVIENQLLSNGLRVVGDTSLEGTIRIVGQLDKTTDFYQTLVAETAQQVGSSLNDALFAGFSDKVFDLIKTQGISVDKLSVGDKLLIEGGKKLSANIQDSNLRTVGNLKELQVDGELMVNNGSIYVGKKRVGINTVEPGGALSVWDGEIEFEVSKASENVGYIGLPRKQDLVIGVNSQKNIRVLSNGGTEIKKLHLGAMSFESDSAPPNYAGTKGAVVFNSNPSEGGPMGWVCLGGAKWANFGIID